MDLTNFIFSEKRSDRIKLHLLFWVSWYAYTLFTHAANPFKNSEITYFRYPEFTLTESFFTVIAQIPTVYAMMYFVFPMFVLKNKYMLSLVWIIIIWFVCGAFTLILLGKVMLPILASVLPPGKMPQLPDRETSFIMAVMSTNKGAYTIIASALMLKFGKHWYQKQHRNMQLQKENTEAQLQLLTAQVHPHFLFNTLNNIYSITQTESPLGSKMIMSLSDMLRYMLYEGPKLLVPLKQELTMVEEYIKLEQIRHGDKLEVHMRIPDKTDDIYIAPLLLLPFVENSINHGAGTDQQNPWINLTIELKNETMVMKLMNGKSQAKESRQTKSGAGIRNVYQRLDLLYEGKYRVKITDDEEVFIVDLQIELIRVKSKEQIETIANRDANISYA
jgi:sensor histidine kinase YesM